MLVASLLNFNRVQLFMNGLDVTVQLRSHYFSELYNIKFELHMLIHKWSHLGQR